MEIYQKIQATAKSCFIATWSMKLLCDSIKDRITERKEINCELMSNELCTLLNLLYHENKLLVDNNLQGGFDFYYPPKVFGGDNYKHSFKTTERNQNIGFDVFHCAVGITYKNQRSNYVRTLMINPTTSVKRSYNFMLLVENEVLKNLRAGVELRKVFEAVISFAELTSYERAQCLKRNFGFLLDPDVEGQSVIIDKESKLIVQENMIFSINIELVEHTDGGETYMLVNGDTVLARKDKPALILTQHKKKYQRFVMEENAAMNVEENENNVIQMIQNNLENIHI